MSAKTNGLLREGARIRILERGEWLAMMPADFEHREMAKLAIPAGSVGTIHRFGYATGLRVDLDPSFRGSRSTASGYELTDDLELADNVGWGIEFDDRPNRAPYFCAIDEKTKMEAA